MEQKLERLSKGEHVKFARMAVENPALLLAMEDLRTSYLEGISRTKPNDKEGREALYLSVKCLFMIKQQLLKVLITAKVDNNKADARHAQQIAKAAKQKR